MWAKALSGIKFGEEDQTLPNPEKRTFVLPAEQASFIDGLVASGNFATGSDVMRAGLESLQDRDEGIERWLREEVAPVYDGMEADPGRGIPIEEVMPLLEAHNAERVKSRSK